MIIGLDISTSITGVTALSLSDKILFNGYVDLRKQKSFFEKAEVIEEEVSFILETLSESPTKIIIEQSLQSFRSGYSSAQTISTLARFNGVVSWIVFKKTGIEPTYISAASARKKCGITVPRGEKAKKVVMEYLIESEPDFSVEYTKYGNIKAQYYDMADSLIIARSGMEKKA